MDKPLIDMTETEMLAEIIKLRALQKLALKRRIRPVTLKVSPKGALSVYGLQKWPVTLYKAQWERLLDQSNAIRDFIIIHAAQLTDKTDSGM